MTTRFRLTVVSLFVSVPISTLSAQALAEPVKPIPTERVALWPGKAPIGDGTCEDCSLEVEVFLPPADKANGAVIVLCPGGGYIRHVTEREGYEISNLPTHYDYILEDEFADRLRSF